MEARPTPTSPKHRTHQTSPQVWSAGALQQPIKLPYGRLTLLIAVICLLVSAGLIAGLAWLVNRYPHSWLTRWMPTTTSTVVEKTPTTSNGKIPSAVSRAAKTLFGLAIDQGATGIYAQGHLTGQASPLSGNGWLVTLRPAWPAGENKLALLPELGQPLPVESTVSDAASPFIFMRTSAIDHAPATIATPASPGDGGLNVWVASQFLRQTTIINARLQPAADTIWLSADRQERYYILDRETSQPVGSAVLNDQGHFLGLLGANGHVWPLTAVEPVLSQIVQSGTIDRPWLGLTYLDQSAATIAGNPTASGLLIGAPAGGLAIEAKSPAEKAGLKGGDVIVSLDGQPASGELFNILSRYHPGDEIELVYRRQSQDKEIKLKLGVRRQ